MSEDPLKNQEALAEGFKAILIEVMTANERVEEIEDMAKVRLTVNGNLAEVVPLGMDENHLEIACEGAVFSIECTRIQNVEEL